MPVEAPAIVRVDAADGATMRAVFDVAQAAGRADDPTLPPYSLAEFRTRRTLAPPLAPPSEWWCAASAGTVAGWYWMKLPDMENRDRAELTLIVHPAARRQGLGRALLRHATS